jgi:hypothetical protein
LVLLGFVREVGFIKEERDWERIVGKGGGAEGNAYIQNTNFVIMFFDLIHFLFLSSPFQHLFPMGASQSGTGSSIGYRLLSIQPSSPAYDAQLVSYFDFIVKASIVKASIGLGAQGEEGEEGVMEMDFDEVTPDHDPASVSEVFSAIVTASNQRQTPLSLVLHNIKTGSERTVVLQPSTDWGGVGLLGAKIRLDSYRGADECVLRVMRVVSVKLGEGESLTALEDYLLGTDTFAFDSYSTLAAVMKSAKRPVRVFVYSAVKDEVRSVTVHPNEDGDIGVDLGEGYIYGIPKERRATVGKSVPRVEEGHGGAGSESGSESGSGNLSGHGSVAAGSTSSSTTATAAAEAPPPAVAVEEEVKEAEEKVEEKVVEKVAEVAAKLDSVKIEEDERGRMEAWERGQRERDEKEKEKEKKEEETQEKEKEKETEKEKEKEKQKKEAVKSAVVEESAAGLFGDDTAAAAAAAGGKGGGGAAADLFMPPPPSPVAPSPTRVTHATSTSDVPPDPALAFLPPPPLSHVDSPTPSMNSNP